jgi:hypothetical protein
MQDAYHVSGSNLKLTQESEESIADDPRGLVLMFEEPKANATYIMGGDPTVGITGWQRHLRVDGDEKTDNAAIEIFRVDAIKMPLLKNGAPDIDPLTKVQRFIYRDLQVCEFAAPVDSVEMARIANMLGRIYAGTEEDQCEFIFESYPGPGILTTQELLRLGYANLWYWETIADSVAEPTRSIGWHSNSNTQKILWYRSRRHLMERRAKISSPYLLAEYSNAVIDIEKMRARAAYGAKDDRIQAANLCYWAGHKWAYDPERTEEPVTDKPFVEHQNYAPTLGEYRSYREQWIDAVDNWG